MFGRSKYSIFQSLLRYRTYFGLIKGFLVHANPLRDFLFGYIFLKGSYPRDISLRTPIGFKSIKLTNPSDTFTVHEIFSWEIYFVGSESSKVVVDFGSNIGVSEVYFLSRHPENVVYGFEPVPKLYTVLQQNVRDFQGRVLNNNCAIADKNGVAKMGVEDSGRYGGIGIETDSQIEVNTVDVNFALSCILHSHPLIDVLKIDIEGMEDLVLSHISDENLAKIKVIYLEKGDDDNFFPAHFKNQFELSSHRGICKYVNMKL